MKSKKLRNINSCTFLTARRNKKINKLIEQKKGELSTFFLIKGQIYSLFNWPNFNPTWDPLCSFTFQSDFAFICDFSFVLCCGFFIFFFQKIYFFSRERNFLYYLEMTTILVEPSLLEKDEIKAAIDSSGFPVFPVKSFDEVDRALYSTLDHHGIRVRESFCIFILADFETELFTTIKKKLKNQRPKVTIIGPPYLLELAANKENGFVFQPGKHIFTNIFKNQTAVVGGKPLKQRNAAINNAKYLGAMIKEDISTKVEFLFTTNLKSSRFQNAIRFGIPVVKRQLIFDMWDQRKNPTLSFNDELIMQNRYRPFVQVKMKLLGFDSDQTFQLEEELILNGGEVLMGKPTESDVSDSLTYILVPNDYPKPEKMTIDELETVVMEEWFWSCIQVRYLAPQIFDKQNGFRPNNLIFCAKIYFRPNNSILVHKIRFSSEKFNSKIWSKIKILLKNQNFRQK
mgnify:CR=1 FL=1